MQHCTAGLKSPIAFSQTAPHACVYTPINLDNGSYFANVRNTAITLGKPPYAQDYDAISNLDFGFLRIHYCHEFRDLSKYVSSTSSVPVQTYTLKQRYQSNGRHSHESVMVAFVVLRAPIEPDNREKPILRDLRSPFS